MSREYLLSSHVPRLNIHSQTSKTDSDIFDLVIVGNHRDAWLVIVHILDNCFHTLIRAAKPCSLAKGSMYCPDLPHYKLNILKEVTLTLKYAGVLVLQTRFGISQLTRYLKLTCYAGKRDSSNARGC